MLTSTGTVSRIQEISDSEGGLPYALGYGDEFGCSVASLGDVNGDGVVDIAVGAQSGSGDLANNFGAVHIIYLNRNGTVKSARKLSNDDANLPFSIPESSRFGAALTALGDTDGDGVYTIAVGAKGISESTGGVYILRLDSTAGVLSAQEIAAVLSANLNLAQGDASGSSLAFSPDLD